MIEQNAAEAKGNKKLKQDKDDFDTYFIDRAKAIMHVIEGAMEKRISDKGSEQTIKNYGVSLED